MDPVTNKVREGLPAVEKPAEKAEQSQKETDSRLEKLKVSELAEIGRDAVETVNLVEDSETSGRVSEVLSKTREDAGGGSAAKAQVKRQKIDPAKIREQLLKSMPGERVMRNHVEREIKREIKYLHKKAMKMLRSPHEMNYFEMSNIVKKIRDLKAVLLRLIKASVESLKTLWLRYVHGVM